MVMVILLFAFGIFLAWLVDTHFIMKRKPALKAEGVPLLEALRVSSEYERIQDSQKIPPSRSFDRGIHNSNSLVDHRNGRDGGQVLRIDSRR